MLSSLIFFFDPRAEILVFIDGDIVTIILESLYLIEIMGFSVFGVFVLGDDLLQSHELNFFGVSRDFIDNPRTEHTFYVNTTFNDEIEKIHNSGELAPCSVGVD